MSQSSYSDRYQRRISAVVDHLRPARWNWSLALSPDQPSAATPTDSTTRNLHNFWYDGLFSAISENFYLSFIPLFALAYGASNGQIGWLTAFANLMGAVALFPGATLVERRPKKRKRLVVWSAGIFARLFLLSLAILPLFFPARSTLIIVFIVLLNGGRAFANNFSNPAWTAMVADIVPFVTRGKYFSSRNMAMGVAALLVAPLAGQLIKIGNGWGAQMGYQLVFGLAFIAGIISTLFFSRVKDSPPTATTSQPHQKGDLRRTLHQQPTFLIFVISAFVFNMSLQVAAPFFNVYLVQEFNASTTIIGMIASISSLTALFGQRLFGRLLDQRGAIWIQLITGFTIPLLPLAWMLITAPWQVGIINTLGGFIWAGYTLSNFNLLLELTPETQRPRAVALYQTAVFSSAVVGPLLGGYLADNISFLMIFAFSGVGRFAGMGLFWWGVARQKTKQPV